MASDGVVQVMPRLARTLYVVRWIVILGVLGESQLELVSGGWNRSAISIAAGAMAVLTLAAGLGKKAVSGPGFPKIVLLADIAFVSFVVYETGGIQSPLYPLYYVTVLTAAILISTRAALVTAVGASAVLVGIELGEGRGSLVEALVVGDVIRTFPYLFLIAVITGTMMDRIRVLAETTAALREERARTESEMAVARKVQDAQLPSYLPQIEGVEIAAIYKPAREVGGDTYDFFPVQSRRIGVMVADVCGKGVPAALLVAGAKYSLREHWGPDMQTTISRASAHIHSLITDDTFVTVTYGVADMDLREFRYVNAGGMYPILLCRQSGRASLICHSDPPLGIDPNQTYSEHRVPMGAGDTIIIYSDGLADALAGGGEGVDKLLKVIEEIGVVPLEKWREKLLALIENPAHVDDVTAIAVRIT